ncbi:Histone-lysine N-methyltransferase trithorax [Gracilariopsis chorda]|uniref:Histone-lysine N-methyltransferase trithorax n=1 Tax=Gracilariopsis chorda TaxID=448386 RepID=A0A2V3J632_9FLOR|nr:Histone-lysine N-methyltransferase trithorax [Gracilariopsis chorda]|eukprot:PXF49447.1 Histone-lysine N-methyltransferase trithorax [Gracilariopsis chorda]
MPSDQPQPNPSQPPPTASATPTNRAAPANAASTNKAAAGNKPPPVAKAAAAVRAAAPIKIAPATEAALVARACPAADAQAFALQRLSKLPPLVEKLAASLTCSICLDYMEEAHQLQCSHIFCPNCISRMLAMPHASCPICKRKTAKRMLSPIISFSTAVASLRALQKILQQCNISKSSSQPASALHDGFEAAVTSAVARMQQTQRRLSLKAHQIDDTDDRQRPVSRVCALCPKGVGASFFGDQVKFGHFKPAPSPSRRSTLYAHHYCAMYSSTVYDVDGTLHGIDDALSRNDNVVCARSACGRTRASVACAAQECSKQFHYACAVLEHCVLIDDGYKAYCVLHADRAPKIDDTAFKKSLSDPAGKESLEHDDVCYLCNRGGRLLMCDTCDRCVHPACTRLRAIPKGDWSCAVCLGAGRPSGGASRGSATSKKRGRRDGCEDNESDEDFEGRPTGGSAKRARTKAMAPRTRTGRKRFVLSYTGLAEAQREVLRTIAKSRRCSVRSDVDEKVTHVVISCYNATDRPVRTMKLCKAIASKKTILCWKWVEESFHERHEWADTEGHVHSLTWKKDDAFVYEGVRFHFGCYNGPREKKEELMSLVQMGGGCVVQRENGGGDGGEEGVVYVMEDLDVKRSGRREEVSRVEPPAGAKVVTSTCIVDLCTKKRSS